VATLHYDFPLSLSTYAFDSAITLPQNRNWLRNDMSELYCQGLAQGGKNMIGKALQTFKSPEMFFEFF
jgi:hypothetical protein